MRFFCLFFLFSASFSTINYQPNKRMALLTLSWNPLISSCDPNELDGMVMMRFWPTFPPNFPQLGPRSSPSLFPLDDDGNDAEMMIIIKLSLRAAKPEYVRIEDMSKYQNSNHTRKISLMYILILNLAIIFINNNNFRRFRDSKRVTNRTF